MSCYKQLISRKKLDIITMLVSTTTPNHNCFVARRILDLSFVTVYIMHDKERSGIWGLKTGPNLAS